MWLIIRRFTIHGPSFGSNATDDFNSVLHSASGKWVDKFLFYARHTYTLSQTSCHFYTSKYNFRAWFSFVKLQNVILYTSKNNNQSVTQIFLEMVDSHSVKITCSVCHLGIYSYRPDSMVPENWQYSTPGIDLSGAWLVKRPYWRLIKDYAILNQNNRHISESLHTKKYTSLKTNLIIP